MHWLEEPLPSNYSLFLTGPPGVGKFEFCLDLMAQFLKDGEKVIYLSTETSIDEIIENVDVDLEEYLDSSLFFIDCYLWESEALKDRILRVETLVSLKDLSTGIEEAVAKLGEPPVRIIFHSLSPLFLSPLFLDKETADISRFVQGLTAKVKTEYGTIIYSLQTGVHNPQTINNMTSSVDGHIEMKYSDRGGALRKMFRTHHLKGLKHPTEWVEVTEKK